MDDFEYYKAALACWSARNNFLVNKWTKVLSDIENDISELTSYSPSHERQLRICSKNFVKQNIIAFISDLKAPALSDLDFEADRDSFEAQSKKCLDATQIELLDGDYVRQSL